MRASACFHRMFTAAAIDVACDTHTHTYIGHTSAVRASPDADVKDIFRALASLALSPRDSAADISRTVARNKSSGVARRRIVVRYVSSITRRFPSHVSRPLVSRDTRDDARENPLEAESSVSLSE